MTPALATITPWTVLICAALPCQQQGGIHVLAPPAAFRIPILAAINGDGSVGVGRMVSLQSNQEHAFRWTEALGVVDLGVLIGQPAPGSAWSRASSVDASGDVVVGELRRIDLLNGEAFVWTRQFGYDVLATLPGGGRSVALDVSADGSIVVGWSERAHPLRPVAVLWTNTVGPVTLPPLPYSGQFSAANAVSGNGAFVVGISNGRAFRWSSSSGIEELGLLQGTSESEALDVSADGAVVVGVCGNPGAGFQGCVWTSQGHLSLGAGYRPMKVSEQGDLVVGQGPTGGFVWTPQGGIQAIEALVQSLGYSVPGQYLLDRPLAISLHGGWIGGLGSDFTPNLGGAISWRLSTDAVGVTYCSPAIPNQTGVHARISAGGFAGASANQLVLHADRLPANSFLFFLTSRLAVLIPQPPNSVGNLCLGGAIGRYVGPGQILATGSTGTVQLQLDLTSTPIPTGLVAVVTGETWYFQGWYRDNILGQLTSNFTDAVGVTFQ